MKKILVVLVVLAVIFSAQAIADTCFSWRGFICPIGSYQKSTVLLNGQVYSICCIKGGN